MVAFDDILGLIYKNKALLLAHHEPAEYNHTVNVRGIRLCARCTGVYLGIFLALCLVCSGWTPQDYYLTVIAFLLPLPAMVDWTAHMLAGFGGSNIVRVSSGLMIGFAYIALIATVFKTPFEWRVYASAILFGGWALYVVTKGKKAITRISERK